ncbi:hypothetical protein G7048_20305 [Diaphorobacter sp. HDW4B]|uniref:hypothetical protein n=1 Tax=Diaphorobacter sp. HDW4B TaxID=2714925 RepID=UPI00140872C6|nr:hypothetical protein [Diaphorobacter sp. HDW4B]QIL72490.1 hypothetical protein G7048_20305 [Diaphorobacter sp. HDW4B]
MHSNSIETPALGQQLMQAASRFKDVWLCLAIGLICFVVFNANLRTISVADSYTARFLPLSIWKHHSLALEPMAEHMSQGAKIHDWPTDKVGWINQTPYGKLVSLYPLVTPLLVTPLYLPSYLYLEKTGWDYGQVDEVARIMEKLSASFIASLSTMLLFLVLRRQCSKRLAVTLALVFAFGTSTWVISSQALWMHGIAQLLMAWALWLVADARCNVKLAASLGLACALIACNRQPDTLLAAGFAAYALVWARGYLWAFVAGTAVPVLFTLAYNLGVTGYLMGGYGVVAKNAQAAVSLLDAPEGIAALLISPVHGLFVFSPFLLLIVLRLRAVISGSRPPLLAKLLATAVAAQILFYGIVHWVQGVSWGPRYLTDMLPILFWMLPPAIATLQRNGRAVFAAACAAAVVIEALGAFGYTGSAHAEYLVAHKRATAILNLQSEKQAIWQLSNTPFLRPPVLQTDLGTPLAGSIDRVSVTAYGSIVVEGWSLLGGQEPFDLHLLVDGKKRPASTDTFFVRPDIEKTLGYNAAAGWRLIFSAKDFAPGKHVFTAMVRSHPNAQPRILPNFVFELPSTSIDATKPPVQGSIDAVNVLAAQTVDISGWALAHGDTPTEISLLFDGKPYPAKITQFFERLDVVQYTTSLAHSGWRITLPVDDLTPGENVVTALVRSRSSGEAFALPATKVTIPSRMPQYQPEAWSLADASRYASGMLAHRQDPQGYWLTEHTQSTRFERSTHELNLFANAEILDILGPVAREANAQALLDRARRFLSTQIEDSGLVRYHGRPDLATHGTISCRITPDADDTALIWRVASNGNQQQQDMALATLQRYRTADGLYRTWLAPKDQFECIDPGADPNPPDIGIQIHVLLWLAQAYPEQAPALCRALQKQSMNERLWVYYHQAPAAIAMRLEELQAMGCPLELPSQRLTSTVAGQQTWLLVLERIRQLQRAPTDNTHHADNTRLLSELASNGFEAVKRDPLLFFHNDPSASVKRFYWSQEMGYALWLRLYHDNERAKTNRPATQGRTP